MNYKKRFNVPYNEVCPNCFSDDMLIIHPNAICSKGCARCMIEWDGDEIRDIVDGEIFELDMESEFFR